MNNTEKKLDALIDALGFDAKWVEEVKHMYDPIDIGISGAANPFLIPKHTIINTNYKITKRDSIVPLKVDSKEWGCIVDFVISHRDDIINDVNDYGGLGFVLDFMERNNNEEI